MAPNQAPWWNRPMTVPTATPNGAWPREPGSGRGRSHGTSSNEPFDRWFRYPAGFASDYVELLLDQLALVDGEVVDCFAGSGVTGTAARQRGIGFAGIEAHPLIGELAQLKLCPTATASEIEALAQETAARTTTTLETRHANIAQLPELIHRSFSKTVLEALVTLRDTIKTDMSNPASTYLKWALLATLRDVAGVKVGWPYQRPGVARKPRYDNPIERFKLRAQVMADDLRSIGSSLDGPYSRAQINIGDSSNHESWRGFPEDLSACIASPPYLNNFDYADATRLELYFWGDISSWKEMCDGVRSDMITATTQQSTVAKKRSSIRELEDRAPHAPGAPVDEILRIVQEIDHVKSKRNRRSKEYDQVAPAYFNAMWNVLQNLHKHLALGATALWLVGDSAPYGVYIDTPRLIGELAGAVGFEYVDDVQLRVRGNRWGTNADRHQIPLAERLIVLKKR